MVLGKTEVAVANLVSELMGTFHYDFPYILYPPDYEVSIPTMYIHL